MKSMTTKQAEATGHLVTAADTAEKLSAVLAALQQIVKARAYPAALIGLPMADVIEEYAADIVGLIRNAAGAQEE